MHQEELHLGGHQGEHALGEERAWQQGVCRPLGGVALRARSGVVVVWQQKRQSCEAALGGVPSMELVQVGDQ